jgi:hypothetical protein
MRTSTAVQFDVILKSLQSVPLRDAGLATGAVLCGVQALYSNDHCSLQPQSLLAGDVWHNTRYLAIAFAATI